MIWLGIAVTASLAIGIVIGRAYTLRQVTKRKAALHELHMELRGPLDFALCDASGRWQAVR